MRAEKLAAGKADVDAGLVRRLIASQFPHWAALPVTPVELDGWDNWTFRLGEQMKVRLPSAPEYAPQVGKEAAWLHRLAPVLPLPIPRSLAVGEPGDGYPFRWSVQDWLPGEPAGRDNVADPVAFAADLARFLGALQSIDASGGPLPGPGNFHRGGDLGVYDVEVRESLAVLGDRIDNGAAFAVWEEARASAWTGPPVWVHGDIAAGNLLVRDGRLAGVIDFGSSAVGDPACDLVISWVMLGAEAREALRAALPLDSGTWARARGWALWKAALVLARGLAVSPAERPPIEVLAALLPGALDGE